MNRLSNNELLFITCIFIAYSAFMTAFMGIRKPIETIKVSDYELGKRIGARAVKDYLIETNQIKTPILSSPIRIRNIEDSLELNFKK